MIRAYYTQRETILAGAFLLFVAFFPNVVLAQPEMIKACVITDVSALSPEASAACLDWHLDNTVPFCGGAYSETAYEAQPLDEIRIQADNASLYLNGRSKLQGHVRVHETTRILSANTAYIDRDAATNKVTRVHLLGQVRFEEPGKLMVAREVTFNPQTNAGIIQDALYRLTMPHFKGALPASGRASQIERFPNEDIALKKATYSTCAPTDRAWQIKAKSIVLTHATERGVARDATLTLLDVPVLYSPYLSFPATNARQSGFLMPMYGYSNIAGFDLGLPYYWNMAPNYDATIIPHVYTRRGVMLGGNFRFLTPSSTGVVGGNFLPHDRVFNEFLTDNRGEYSILDGVSSNRWSFLLREDTQLLPNLNFKVNYQAVSDSYFLQDFSTNLATVTQNQLLREGDLTYVTDHWLFNGKLQSYQTLEPINQEVARSYERLPQLLARANYTQLPLNATLGMDAQFDYFRWPIQEPFKPQGPRYHVNPELNFPQVSAFGYVTPGVELVENYYELYWPYGVPTQSFNRTIPQYHVDSGLFFERDITYFGERYTQTMEPRLYYLNVPYHNQSNIPTFDSGYMIFNTDQLFRVNHFSGFDRISDANQLTLGLTSRWLMNETGAERAAFTVGQIAYFENRRVALCYSPDGSCEDSPETLGYLSPLSKLSPIASRLVYQMSSRWSFTGDWVWDPDTSATNNSDLNVHYQRDPSRIFTLGYSYLVNGNLTPVAYNLTENNALHQATMAYAWPFNEQWSSLGVYSYNLSKQYSMLSLFGLQYESCCWAFRLFGGRTFKNLSSDKLRPEYNSNLYFQVLLKGLGSVANSDPATTIQSYLPGYGDLFHS